MNNGFISSNLLKNVNFEELDSNDKNYDYYLQAKSELNEQFNLDDVLATIDNSNLTDDYVRLMKNFDTDILYLNNNYSFLIQVLLYCILKQRRDSIRRLGLGVSRTKKEVSTKCKCFFCYFYLY